MKKINVLLIMMMFLSGMIFAQSITVTAPGGGVTWYKGDTHNINWVPSNCQITNYKINIFKDSVIQANFKLQLTASNTTSKSWMIPGTFESGNYIIRVKTDDGLCVGDSQMFFIADQAAVPTLTVTNPTSGTVWEKGSSYPITWDTTGPQPAGVIINVFRNSISQANFIEQITGPNSGVKNWTIPVSYQSGNYYLRVKSDDNSCYGDSSMFQITDHPVQPEASLEIINPHSGTVWRKGITYSITWNKSGQQSAGVKIRIYKNSISQPNFLGEMAGPNSGTKSWSIPGTYATGTYYLKITTDDNQVTADSEPFQIKPKFQISPEMDAFPIHGKIEIIKPSTSSNWKEGTSQQIKWKNTFTKDKGITIDLYNNTGSTFIKKITTILPLPVKKINRGGGKPPDTSTHNWFIPKGTYQWPGNFRIKIRRADGKASGLSDMFHIQIGTKKKVYEINGSIGNYCKRTFWASGSGSQAAVAKLKEQLGGCVGVGGWAQGWAGYANYLVAHGGTYYGDIWRTHVTFDLSQFIGKGIILDAKLKLNKQDYPAGSNCPISVYKMASSLVDAFNINGEVINPYNMTSIAQGWMGFPNDNHGIMIVGPDESFQHNQSKCQAYLGSIKLVILFLEKE